MQRVERLGGRRWISELRMAVKRVEDLTCVEAAKIFKKWSRDAQFRETSSRLQAQAQILHMFGDQKIPTQLHEDYNLERELE